MAHGPLGAAHMTVPAADVHAMISDRVRSARSERRPLRIAGAGTWLDAGRPATADDVVSTAAHVGVTEYVPGDLTITARAGTTLAELREATGRHRQYLALDPWGSDDGTIGATVATGTAGPLSTAFGTPRDALLGLTMVTGHGTVVHAGGRVVKNVAGFDLPRLVAGSWGTLGVVTAVTLRLRGQPQEDRTVALRSTMDAGQLRVRIAALPFTPVALEYTDDGAPLLLARLHGNAASVEAQQRALAGLGDVERVEHTVWRDLRVLDGGGAFVWRLSALPAEIAGLVTHARAVARSCHGGRWHAALARGVVRCVVPGSTPPDALLAAVQIPFAGTRIGERLPPEAWSFFPAAGDDRLSSGIKRAFDPDGILNPGIMGSAA